MNRQLRQNFILFLLLFVLGIGCAKAASEEPTPTAEALPTTTATEAATPTATTVVTLTPDVTAAASPTVEATLTTEVTPTDLPVYTITPEPTPLVTPADTPTPEVTPDVTLTPEPSGTPTPSPTKRPTPTPYTAVISPSEEKNYNVSRTDIEASVGKLSTVRVDGKKETFWGYCDAYMLNNVILGEADTSAQFQVAWDSEYLYLYIEVTDKTYDVSSELFTRKDGIEIFVNESNSKGSHYDKGDQHYQIIRDGSLKCGNGASDELIRYSLEEVEEGYVAEVAIAFVLWEGKRGSEIGLDIRINDSFGNGGRDYIVQWSDTTLKTYTDLSKIGTITLR